jgi:hypothetical protein
MLTAMYVTAGAGGELAGLDPVDVDEGTRRLAEVALAAEPPS